MIYALGNYIILFKLKKNNNNIIKFIGIILEKSMFEFTNFN